MMGDAVKIRQSEADRARTRFNALPEHVRNTLFHDGDTMAARWLPPSVAVRGSAAADTPQVATTFSADLAAARAHASAMSAEGKTAFADGRWTDAQRAFERAAGVFCYIRAVRDDWKKRGIVDEDIEHVPLASLFLSLDVARAGTNEQVEQESGSVAALPTEAQLRHEIATYLVNVSLAAMKQADACAAGGEATAPSAGLYRGIAIGAAWQAHADADPSHLKAAYRWASLTTSGATATATDVERAVRELRETLRRHGPPTRPENATDDEWQRLGDQHAECCNFLTALEAEEAALNRRGQTMMRAALKGAASTDHPVAHPEADGSAVTTAAVEKVEQPFYSQCRDGWNGVAKQRAAAEATRASGRDKNSPALALRASEQADAQERDADRLETQLMDACANKLGLEFLVPMGATHPVFLTAHGRSAVGRVVDDPRHSHGVDLARGSIQALGFSLTEFDSVAESNRPSTQSREAKMYDALLRWSNARLASADDVRGKPLSPHDVDAHLMALGLPVAAAPNSQSKQLLEAERRKRQPAAAW